MKTSFVGATLVMVSVSVLFIASVYLGGLSCLAITALMDDYLVEE